MEKSLVSIVIVCAAIVAAFTAGTGHATTQAAAACPSLANVIGYTGHAQMTFAANATGTDPQGGDHFHLSLDRRATGLAVDLNRKIGNDSSRLVMFIGHAHGGFIKVDDRLRETNADSSPRYSGTQSFSGSLTATSGAAQLYVDRSTCKAKLHVSFLVNAGYAGSKQLRPSPNVGGAIWTEPVTFSSSLSVVGGDGPDVLNHGCAGGSPILSTKSCYLASGGWTSNFTTLRLCHSPSQNNCDVTTPQQVGQAGLIFVLKAKLAN